MQKAYSCEINAKGREVVKCLAISELGTVYTGRAICSPDDEFSLRTGMRIAEIRALLGQLKLIAKNNKFMRDNLRVELRRAARAYTKAQDKIDQLQFELAELTEQ